MAHDEDRDAPRSTSYSGSSSGSSSGGDGDGGPRRRSGRRRVCKFCAEKEAVIDYKDPQSLRYFITERGKIVPRRISGNCAMHQRKVTGAIKRARNIALLPFTVTS